MEDRLGLGAGAWVEVAPHVQAAVDQLRADPAKVDRLRRAVSAELVRRCGDSRP